jgi:hypothetical protein
MFLRQSTLGNRKREEEQSHIEDSPKRNPKEQLHKKSLSKSSNFQLVKVSTSNLYDAIEKEQPNENESMGSTPKAEGGIDIELGKNVDSRFNFLSEKESVVDE